LGELKNNQLLNPADGSRALTNAFNKHNVKNEPGIRVTNSKPKLSQGLKQGPGVKSTIGVNKTSCKGGDSFHGDNG